jgi:hypothetical protein
VTLTFVEPTESPAEPAACGLAIEAPEAPACDATIAKPLAAESVAPEAPACDATIAKPQAAESVATEEPLAEIGPGDVVVEEDEAFREAPAPSPPAFLPQWERGDERGPSPRERRQPARVSIVHWPYAWFLRRQQRFHRLTFRLGIVGRLVRSQIFVSLLGMLGLAFLLVAIAWLVRDGFRWTW